MMEVTNNVYEISKLIANYKEMQEVIKTTNNPNYKRMIRNILSSRYGKYSK